MRRLALLVVASVVAIAGCVAAGAASSQALPAGVERPVTPRTYPTGGISLAQPGGELATVNATSAYGVCASGEANCPVGPPGLAELALTTDSQYGDIKPDGSVTHSIQNRLTWVFTWNTIACPPRLGPKPPAGQTNAPAVCDWLVIVDAQTGRFLITYAGPAGM